MKNTNLIYTTPCTIDDGAYPDHSISVRCLPYKMEKADTEGERRMGSRQVRAIPSDLRAKRNDSEAPIIEGYFAVFNSNYQISKDMSESVAPGAFSKSLEENDVRALVNHDTTLVLGRTKSGTLQLKEDEKGLFGTIQVNPNDRSAMDLYERVSRGDVDGCSFGFDIRAEETEIQDDGSIHWTMTDIDLGEVSCCTFPAYQETNIEARAEDAANLKKREVEALKEKLKNKLKGEE